MSESKFKVGDRDKDDWRKIGDWPYWISKDGKVFSEHRGQIIKGWKDASGYPAVILIKKGKRFNTRQHQLVMRWFVGPRPLGSVINHKNGIKSDSRLENLEYCTPKENRDHAKAMRLYSYGERCSWAKLNEEKVAVIRRAKVAGMSLRQLAKAFDVSPKTILKVVKEQVWLKDCGTKKPKGAE